MMPGEMMAGPWWGGFGLFGWLLMLLFWVLIILGVVLLVRWLVEQTRPRRAVEESALEILKKRYARGEVEKQEFETKKRDLM
ncbi:MAG: SHOCT domain-containing protein [Candidatus Methylomirabilia bacterium]